MTEAAADRPIEHVALHDGVQALRWFARYMRGADALAVELERLGGIEAAVGEAQARLDKAGAAEEKLRGERAAAVNEFKAWRDRMRQEAEGDANLLRVEGVAARDEAKAEAATVVKAAELEAVRLVQEATAQAETQVQAAAAAAADVERHTARLGDLRREIEAAERKRSDSLAEHQRVEGEIAALRARLG